MRRLLPLFLFAALALFFGAQERAFAHPAHHSHHIESAQPISSSPAAQTEVSARGAFFFEVASAISAEKCPHQEKHDGCGFCCACSCGVPAALAVSETISREFEARAYKSAASSRATHRHSISDLSRPPKSFA